MRQKLIVTPDVHGQPHAEVPFCNMWDLVEYLSYQRVAVCYNYHPTHFVVTFPKLDLKSAQSYLDAWASAQNVLQEV